MKKNADNHQAPLFTGYSESYVKLTKHRILFLSEDITEQLASELSALLLYFDNEDCEAPIELYINSNGGATTGLFNICDMMQLIRAPIRTICAGCCYSAAAVILSAGTKGERCAFPNSKIMIHGIQTGIPQGDVSKFKGFHDFLVKHNDDIMKVLAHHTGQSLDRIRQDCREDMWMNAEQALAYNLIDRIL